MSFSNTIDHLCSGFVFKEILSGTFTQELTTLLERAVTAFSQERLCMELDFSGKTVVFIGDIHGDPSSIINTLIGQDINPIALPPNVVLMWCGDYVDRGKHGIEALILVCALKLRYPNNVYVIRGNHETEEISSQYGFLTEVGKRMPTHSDKFLSAVYSIFSVLPVCIFATFNDGRKVFVAHGGFGDDVLSCANANELNTRLCTEQRMCAERPYYEPPCIHSITWSDPTDVNIEFSWNSRGAGCEYGTVAIDAFRAKFGIDFIVRAHQLADSGITHTTDGRVVTVFSVANYCYRGNRAAIIIVRNGELPANSTRNFETVRFDCVPPVELKDPESASPPGSSSDTVSPAAAATSAVSGLPAGFEMFSHHAVSAVFDGPPTSSVHMAPPGARVPAPDLDALVALGF